MKRAIRNLWYRLLNARRISRLRKAGNVIEIDRADLGRVKIKDQGATGCTVRIGKLAPGRGMLDLRLCCSDSEIDIAPGVGIARELDIFVGGLHRPSRVRVFIGEKSTFQKCKVFLLNSNSTVSVGRECMFAYDILLHHTDVHPIYDGASGEITNAVRELKVGDRVWVGAQATLLKNAVVPDGCIVGWGSVVSGRFDRPNVVVAGNPARIRTPEGKSIRWAATDPAYYANLV